MKVPPLTREKYKDRLRKLARQYGFETLDEDGQAALKDEANLFPRDYMQIVWDEMRKPRCSLCGEKADRVIEFGRGTACVECIEDGARRIGLQPSLASVALVDVLC